MNYSDKEIDTMIQALEALKTEQAMRIRAETQLEAQRGKVLFADAVTASGESILVREMAVVLKQGGVEIGETRLFDWLRGNGYLYRQPGGRNLPTQKSLKLGVMELKKTVIVNAYGKSHVSVTPVITATGRAYFFDKVMEQKDVINTLEAEKKEQQRLHKNTMERQRYAKKNAS